MNIKVIAVFFITSFYSLGIYAGQISPLSKEAAYCEGVYAYAMQLMQVRNNNGAANNINFRYSRVLTANLWINLENGVVSADKISQFKSTRVGLKKRFDTNPNEAINELTNCDNTTLKIWNMASSKNITWEGKTLEEFRSIMSENIKKQLGL